MTKNIGEMSELNDGLMSLAKTSVIVFIGLFFTKLFTYLYRILVARHFGSEIYGLFSLSLIILGISVTFSSLGLGDGVIRFISLYRGKNEENKIRYVFSFSMKFTIYSGIVSAILLFFLAEFISINIFHNENLIIFIKVFSITLPFLLVLGVFLAVLRGFEEITWHSLTANIIQSSLKFVLLLLLILLGFDSNSVVYAYAIAIFLTFIFSYFICITQIPLIFTKYRLKKITKFHIRSSILSYSWPIMFSGMIVSIFYWTDSFLIGFFKNAIQVGHYNVVVPIVFFLLLAPDLFIQLFLPLVTKEYNKNNLEVIKELSKQVAKWVLIINLPIFIIIFTFPGVIINLLFGKEYLGVEMVLRILSIGGIFSSFTSILTSLISMIGKTKIILINLVSVSIVNFILNWFLIPKYGMVGAAISTTFSWILLSFILMFEVKKYTKIIILRRKMLIIILISLIPFFILFYLIDLFKINIITMILIVIVFLIIYIILMILTKSFDRNDILILKSIKNKIINQS